MVQYVGETSGAWLWFGVTHNQLEPFKEDDIPAAVCLADVPVAFKAHRSYGDHVEAVISHGRSQQHRAAQHHHRQFKQPIRFSHGFVSPWAISPNRDFLAYFLKYIKQIIY